MASYVLLPAEMNRANPAKTVESSSMSDLPLTIEVHLGQREVTLSEIQALQTGAVLPLDTLVTEELELFVSNVRLAKVEVVVRNGWLSARVVDIQRSACELAEGRQESQEQHDEQ